MPVGLEPIEEKKLLPIKGVTLGVTEAGLRRPDRRDLLVIRLCEKAVVAGVFTQNRFCAAPVLICQQRLKKTQNIQALCVNTGYANAGTGQKGINDAKKVCENLAHALNVEPDVVMPFSTGVIMELFPTEKIIQGLPACVENLREDNWVEAAYAIMTTDTMAKGASRQCVIDGKTVTVTGIAKGSGMIQPNMATMLGFIMTDATVDGALLSGLTQQVADHSFNRITVDGDTSTNDSFIIGATGQVPHRPIVDETSSEYRNLYEALHAVALELAQAIVRDGEGATKFITIEVEGAMSVVEGQAVAKAVAHSPLVKTAFFASDPNLGRILSAIGNAGISDLDTHQVSVWLGDVLVAEQGSRAAAYQEADGQRVMAADEITVRIDLGRGKAKATCYTCDLSYEYIKINADYRS